MPELCVIHGDGIGHEVVPAAVEVLQQVFPDLKIINAEAGWDCCLNHGVSVPDDTLKAIHNCGAALFGAVSSPSKKVPGYRSAIITMRQSLDLYSNIRPVKSWPGISPKTNVDMIIVRENTEGLYSGREHQEGDTAIAERIITKKASQRIGLRALQLMRQMKRHQLTIVHKANILPVTDGLFRDTIRHTITQNLNPHEVMQIDELLVDIAALKIISEPQCFNTIITTNLFGDILSDAASYWCGGMGLAPSLNWGESVAIAEPVHGSAPDIAGKNLANPIATILSASLLARYVWKNELAASLIENAIQKTLIQGIGLPGAQNNTGTILKTIIQEISKQQEI